VESSGGEMNSKRRGGSECRVEERMVERRGGW
jgi:hypothetical protein